MDRRFDPRSIVTPYAFAVHPDLLGMPLAAPWQRLGAILLDLVVIGLLTLVGGAPLAIASMFLLFGLASRKRAGEVFGKAFRVAAGCLGFLVLVVSVLAILLVRYSDDVRQLAEEAGVDLETLAEEAGVDLAVQAGGVALEEGEAGIVDMFQAIQGAAAFREAESREEAQTIASDVARNALALGLPRETIRTLLAEGVPEDAPWAGDASSIINETMRGLTTPHEAPAGDEDPASGAPAEEASPAMLDSIERLNEAVLVAREERDDLRDALTNAERHLAEAESRGLLDWLYDLIDDLGLGFGWGALYLTLTHSWWKGTSIGKKVFGIRVVMIDKRPLTLWLSFERAGGYAAGFATGLLGFAQIFWDPNRQGIHDKVSETFVIREGKAPVPGPWIEEGKAQWTRGRQDAEGTKRPGRP